MTALLGHLHWDQDPVLRQGGHLQGLRFPLTGRWLGFEDAHITFDVDTGGTGGIRLRILIDPVARTGPPLAELAGRWSVASGLALTAIVL